MAALNEIKSMAILFIKLSVNILLGMLSAAENTVNPNLGVKFASRPLRPMCLLLDQFLNDCEILDRSCLESFIPYTLLHSSLVDATLGQ
jgi:hypothetical protein